MVEFLFIFEQDTVVDAGMFDGALGIISAISALKVLNITGRLRHLRHPVEVSSNFLYGFLCGCNTKVVYVWLYLASLTKKKYLMKFSKHGLFML